MRDDRNLLRWLDLSWFAPIPLSLGLGIWAAISQPTPHVLAALLALQMALLASASSVPASLAASRSQVWARRVAPGGSVRAVHRLWRQHTLTLLTLGLVGPAAAALRVHSMGETALACWALALPLLGVGLGTLVAWSWNGSLQPAALVMGPALAAAALLMGMRPTLWLDAGTPALATLAAGALLLAMAWRGSQRLHPCWAGVPALWQRRRRAARRSGRRWHWDTLAFDGQGTSSSAGRPPPLIGELSCLLFWGLTGSAMRKTLTVPDIAPGSYVNLALYAGMLLLYGAMSLTLRVSHWRIQLSPKGRSPRAQVAWVLLDSTLVWWSALCVVVAYEAWRHDVTAVDAWFAAGRAGLDAALCVSLSVWLRGLCNRGLVVTGALLLLWLTLAGLLWQMSEHGTVVARGASFMGWQAALTAGLAAGALHTWRRRVPRGTRQGLGLAAD